MIMMKLHLRRYVMNYFKTESSPLRGSTVESTNTGSVLLIKSEAENFYGIIDSEQIKAIASPLPTVVAGVAGTGKSTIILHRIEKAIRDEAMGMNEIFVCSPTPKTAQKMTDNLLHLTNGGAEYTGTIYDNAAELLKTYPALLTIHGYSKDFEPVDDTKFDAQLAETLKPYEEYLRTKFAISRHKAKKLLRAGIKSLKGKGFYSIDMYESPAQVTEENILLLTDAFQEVPADIAFEMYEALQKKMKKENLLDSEDLIALATFAMRDMDIRYKVNKKFKLVIIDGFQDFSELELEMAEYLAHDGKYLYLVGDVNQLIDHSDVNRLTRIMDHYGDIPQAQKIFLETNYRSQAYIATLSFQISRISSIQQTHVLKLEKADTYKVLNHTPFNTNDEADYVKDMIKTLVANGVNADEIAVIARTDKYLEVLENVLTDCKIDYHFEKDNSGISNINKAKANQVQLMTIQGSKGLEFEHVFIIGAVDKVMPLLPEKSQTKPDDKKWIKMLLEGERRLFYVAISRAKETLTILSPVHIGKSKVKHSRTLFLKDLDGLIETNQ